METCKHKHVVLSVAVIVVLIISIVFLVLLFKRHGGVSERPKLIIDHDGGADDAMAIFMALLYEKYFDGPKVIAITTVHGNVNESQVYLNTQRILDIAKRRDVPIYRGSKTALVIGTESDYYFGYDGLGDNATVEFKATAAQPEQAVSALIRLSKAHKDLTVVALGSLTNIALAMKFDNDFVSRLSQLYVAAGNVYSEKYTEAEFNVLMDVEAYHIVATEGKPQKLTTIPFSQIRNNINITNEWRLNVLGAIPTEIMRAQNSFEQVSLPSSKTWVLLDPAAMAVVLNSTSIVEETRYADNRIHLCGEERGVNENLFTSVQNSTTNVVYAVQEEPYKQFLLNVFSAQIVSKRKVIT